MAIQLSFEEFTLPSGCREAHKVPNSECSTCGMDTWDHTVDFSFPVGSTYGLAYQKVCLKDYMKLYPEKRRRILKKGGA